MAKRGFIALSLLFLAVIILFSSQTLASSGSVEDEIKKIVHYAEEYETGNIKFVNLLLYESASRQKLNEILGVIEREDGGLLKEEQIRPVLGEPSEETKWVWSEKEEKQKAIGKSIPAWNKVIFDGKKIQIKMEAWPSLYNKKGKEEIIYRLHFSTDFKKPKDSFNIEQEISKIKGLAEAFSSDSSKEKAESLAKASVNAEKLFESFYRQSGEKCDALMSSIFGSENKRKDEKLLVQEIDFYNGENFVVNAKLEMCDECQWAWINLDFWVEGRGPGFKQPKEGEFSGEIRKKESDGYYKEGIKSAVGALKEALQKGEYNSAISIKSQIRELNNAWNDASNDVWNQVDSQFKNEPESKEEYSWIKQEQQKRKLEKEIRRKNYQFRKEFYSELFKDYEKKELYYSQREYEKRLVELFTTSGREICDNNQDDNKDSKIDCGDAQCGGKICGKEKISVQDDNSTQEAYVNLYCIAETCQMKEEPGKSRVNNSVCGNHLCEAGEQKSCSRDCSVCQSFKAFNCTGKVIFSGENKNSCPLPPVCIEKNLSCQADSDCAQPLCGVSSCVEDQCKVTALTECRKAECTDGDKQFKECLSGERLVSSLCEAGRWNGLNVTCLSSQSPPESSMPGQNASEKNETAPQQQEIVGNECTIKEDCGNLDDVCSNGRCITLPQIMGEGNEQQAEQQTGLENEQEIDKIKEKPEGSKEKEEDEPREEDKKEEAKEESQVQNKNPESQNNLQPKEENTPTLGAVIFNFVRVSLSKIGLTGFEVESSGTPDSSSSENSLPPQSPPADSNSQPSQEQESQQNQNSENQGSSQESKEQREKDDKEQREQRERQEREDNERKDKERRDKEERERRESQCKEDCSRNCNDAKIRPCTEKCIWKSCEGDKLEECDIEQAKATCEKDCKEKEDLSSCVQNCNNNCLAGKEFGVEFKEPEKEENKQELGVFKAGGMCRNAQLKTESFIYFDGWGQPFQELQKIKHKYYEGGQGEWCKDRLESLKKQRKEFEAGFNSEFVTWFFEEYLANSAEDWEEHISGIFELYWMDVDISRETAFQMNCLDIDTLSDYNLIEVDYQTDYGKIEFWEEVKKVKLPEMDKEVEVITPYMKAWVFPSKEFLAYEMKKSMEKHEFPGPSEEKAERKNEEGPTEKEKEMIRQDKKFMNQIRRLSEKYGGSVDVAVQIKDKTKNEIIFNLYAKINEGDIIKMEPMLPSELPEYDMKIEIDFDKVYNLIYSSEKDMQGEHIESPPWDKKARPIQKVKEIINGVKMWFKLQSMLNSAEYFPSESKKDGRALIDAFLPKIMEKGDGNKEKEMKEGQDSDKEIWDSKEKFE